MRVRHNVDFNIVASGFVYNFFDESIFVICLWNSLNISIDSFILGILKHELATSFEKVVEQQVCISESENVVWGPNYQTSNDDGIRYPHRNGYKKHIVVNLYSSEDGHEKFNQLLTRELCRESVSGTECDSKKITIDYIDEKLRKLYGDLPDPDLAVYFGNVCCTTGFMPWQIRLTEFIPISYKLPSLTFEKYVRVLYKYAKCEQRFGKWSEVCASMREREREKDKNYLHKNI